ncbi:glycosyltransferase family 4 protein [Terrarubrum flagellatum]|uniref:glycosyltransferase family 4 protein n=1 Tax=Terrirubrum flagellatum TaxID=2895980 RepID=UPI003145472D
MKRIAVIAPHFQEYALLLANALSRDARVMLVIEQDRLDSEYADRVMPKSPTVEIRNVSFGSPFDALRIALSFLRFRPSVIHIQEASGLIKSVICAVIAALFRPFCTIALTVHDPTPHDGRDAAIAQRLHRFRAFVRRSAHVVFVHGRHCYDEYVAAYTLPGQKVVVTEHGVILAGDQTRAETPPPLRVLSFGRMEKYKGVDVLCEAAEMLSAEGLDFRLRIAGRGPELDQFEERFTKLREVSVANAFIPAAALIKEIEESDCVVLPYLSATQSGVLAAAFANGRFVIASRVGGIPDVVDDKNNGLLVPPNDPKALADAIRLVANDAELRRRLKAGASDIAKGRLNWGNIARDLLAAY